MKKYELTQYELVKVRVDHKPSRFADLFFLDDLPRRIFVISIFFPLDVLSVDALSVSLWI